MVFGPVVLHKEINIFTIIRIEFRAAPDISPAPFYYSRRLLYVFFPEKRVNGVAQLVVFASVAGQNYLDEADHLGL